MTKSSELRSSKFIPLFLTQFLGAFNDNFFKNALVVMLTYQVIGFATISKDTLIQLSSAIFIFPFLLASPLAGQIADKFEKSSLIVKLKIFEIILMIIGATALALHSLTLSWIALFGLGLQATLFGPLKYAILPQHISETSLLGANSAIESGTFLAILIGTILGGLLYTSWAVPIGCIVFAILGWISARHIPLATPGDPSLKLEFNLFKSLPALFKHTTDSLALKRSVLAVSWFWFLGASLLSLFPFIASDVYKGHESLITALLAIFSVGIAVGSWACEKLAQGKIEIGLVPIGAAGMSIFGFLFASAIQSSTGVTASSTWEFLTEGPGLIVGQYLFGLSFFGGLFIVPLYALLQDRSAPEYRSRVIASNNVLNAVFMIVSAIYAILFSMLGGSKQEYIWSLFVLNTIVSLYIIITVPEFFFRFLAWLLCHTVYRVKKQGLQNIPSKGAALLICNHVSFMDGLLVFGACPRPVKFVMWYKIYNLPLFKYLFKAVGAVPIASKSEDPKVMQEAFDVIKKTLEDGDIIVIFPEGAITQDGKMLPFRPGMLKILDQVNVPVIPCALKGLWGSMFSRKEKSIWRFIPKSFFTRRVTLDIATPLSYTKQPDFLSQCENQVKNLLSTS